MEYGKPKVLLYDGTLEGLVGVEYCVGPAHFQFQIKLCVRKVEKGSF